MDEWTDLATAGDELSAAEVRSLSVRAARCADPSSIAASVSFGPSELTTDAASCLTPYVAASTADFMAALYLLNQGVQPDDDVVEAFSSCVEGSFVLTGIDSRFEALLPGEISCLDDEYRQSGALSPFFERQGADASINPANWPDGEQSVFYGPVYDCVAVSRHLMQPDPTGLLTQAQERCVNDQAREIAYYSRSRTDDEQELFLQNIATCIGE